MASKQALSPQNADQILADLRTRQSPHGTIMAVSMMKDEAPFLLEWYAHHLAVGFTRILVYTNDCSDGTVEMLQRLEELGLGYHRHNVIAEGQKPQPSAIKHAQKEPLVQDADWMLLFDADEFLTIRHPSGNLDGMIQDAVQQDANGIVITWRIFGSGGVVDWSRAPVSEQYLYAAPPLWNKGWGVKTLFKFDADYWKLGIHRPSIKNKHLETGFPDTVKWLNGSGQPMEDYFKFRGWRSIRRTLGYNWAQMNHYAVKSIDSYAVRKLRGNVNNKKDKYNADYWSLQDRNEVEDRSILRHAPRRAQIMAALLEDPVLKKLHFAALERVETRLAEYKKTDAYHALKSGLIEAGKVPITQVAAKPPKARDPAKIAALMSRVEQKNADRPKSERRHANVQGWAGEQGSPYMPHPIDLSAQVNVDWIDNHGVALPADPRVFTPEAINAVLTGRFDRRHARNIETYTENASRLLDVGTGIGFIPMKLLKERKDLVVLAQDQRNPLIRVGRSIAERNQMADSARLKFADGPLIFPTDAAGKASGLAAYISDFRPDVLRITPPKGFASGVFQTLDLSTVQSVIVPCSDEDALQTWRGIFVDELKALGFLEDVERAAAGSLMFLRAASRQ